MFRVEHFVHPGDSPAMPRFFPAIAIALLLVTLAPRVSFGQTGAELLIKPLMHESEVWESSGEAPIIADGETDNDQDYHLNIFDYQGRVAERKQPFVPRLGWDFTYLDLNIDDVPGVQDVVDVSVGAAVELGTYSQWQSGLAVGVGYAGNSPFGEGDAYYGMATLRVGRQITKTMDLALVIDYDGNRSIFPDIPLPGFALRASMGSAADVRAGRAGQLRDLAAGRSVERAHRLDAHRQLRRARQLRPHRALAALRRVRGPQRSLHHRWTQRRRSAALPAASRGAWRAVEAGRRNAIHRGRGLHTRR